MYWSSYPNTPAILDEGLKRRVEQELSRYRLSEVHALHATNKVLRILASKDDFFWFWRRFYKGRYSLPSWEIQDEKFTRIFCLNPILWGFSEELEEIVTANQRDINEKIKGIRLYQGTLDEVANSLGKELEMVDTKGPETFIKVRNSQPHLSDANFWLRVEAYKLGADALIHYQPSSAMGTPVRFKK